MKYKPCPFCGNTEVGLYDQDSNCVYCNDCDALMHKDDWNTRQREQELEKRVHELEQAIDEIRIISTTPSGIGHPFPHDALGEISLISKEALSRGEPE